MNLQMAENNGAPTILNVCVCACVFSLSQEKTFLYKLFFFLFETTLDILQHTMKSWSQAHALALARSHATTTFHFIDKLYMLHAVFLYILSDKLIKMEI